MKFIFSVVLLCATVSQTVAQAGLRGLLPIPSTLVIDDCSEDCSSSRCREALLRCPFRRAQVRFGFNTCRIVDDAKARLNQKDCVDNGFSAPHNTTFKDDISECLCLDGELFDCSPRGDQQQSTLLEVLRNYGGLTAFAGSLPKGLKKKLDRPGQYTVFAPIDAAFEAAGYIDNVEQAIKFHVVEGAILSSDLDAFQLVETLQGKQLRISADSSGVTVSDGLRQAQVVGADVVTSNGVIHVINGVLLPPTVQSSLVEYISGTQQLSTFQSLLENDEELYDLLESGPFTVFAPTNAAIKLSPGEGEEGERRKGDCTSSEECIQQAVGDLAYYVVPGMVSVPDLLTYQTVATLNEGLEVVVRRQGDIMSVNGARVVESTMVSNGIVHSIDQPLVTPGPIFEFLNNTDFIQVLYEFLDVEFFSPRETQPVYDLLELLETDGPFTIFVPTADAVDNWITNYWDNEKYPRDGPPFPSNYVRFVKNHIISGRVLSPNLTDGTESVERRNILGYPLTARLRGSEYEIDSLTNSPKVFVFDGIYTNGVIHGIEDALNMPAWDSIAVADSILGCTTLASLVRRRPELYALYTGASGVAPGFGKTLLAPTDEAFADAGVSPDDDTDAVTEVIKYHMVEDFFEVQSFPVKEAVVLPTLQGSDLTAFQQSFNVDVFFGDDGVKAVPDKWDFGSDNGPVTLIDGVLQFDAQEDCERRGVITKHGMYYSSGFFECRCMDGQWKECRLLFDIAQLFLGIPGPP